MRSLAVALLLVCCLTGCGESAEADAGTDAGDDASAPTCSTAAACDDGLFCNGSEACDPSATDADARGCVSGVSPCTSPGECDEEGDMCRACGTPDMDGDGHARLACGGDDCDDTDASRFPGNAEICDSDDEDCDDATFGVLDADGDERVSSSCCNGSTCGPDCDDTNPAVGLLFEICDVIDNDCDTRVDESTSAVDWYPDTDGDGFGNPMGDPVRSCTVVAGASVLATDCDDTDPAVRRGALERCNGRDDDCDDLVDEGECVDGGVPPMDGGPADGGPPDGGPPTCIPATFGSTSLGNSCFQ